VSFAAITLCVASQRVFIVVIVVVVVVVDFFIDSVRKLLDIISYNDIQSRYWDAYNGHSYYQARNIHSLGGGVVENRLNIP
jgi:hypothetical protein